MIGFCLTLLDEWALWTLAAMLHSRLSSAERRFLAGAALMALDDDEYQAVIDFAEGSA